MEILIVFLDSQTAYGKNGNATVRLQMDRREAI